MFKHKGTDIAVTDKGQFTAYVDGHEVVAPSLAAMKKKLDKVNPFEQFDALDTAHGNKPVRVVGISRARASWRSDKWKLRDGSSRRSVYANTPENKKTLAELAAMLERHSKVDEAQRAERQNLETHLQELKPTKEA